MKSESNQLFSVVFKLWTHLSKSRRMQLGGIAVMMLLSTFAETLSLGAILPFLAALAMPERVFSHPWAEPLINMLGLTEPQQLVLPCTIIFVAAVLCSGAFRLAYFWMQSRVCAAISADLSVAAYRRTMYLPYAKHASQNSSNVIAGVNKTTGIATTVIAPVLTLCNSVIMLFIVLLVLLSAVPPLVFGCLIGFGLLYAGTVVTFKQRLSRNSERVSHDQTQRIKAMQEGLGGIRDVVLDGTQETHTNIFRKSEIELTRAQSNIAIMGGIPRYAMETLGIVLIAVVTIRLADGSGGIGAAIPFVGVLALGAQRMLPVLQHGYQAWSLLQGSHASARDALALLDQPLPASINQPPPAQIPFEQDIVLTNLDFRYNPETPWVLRDINLQIFKGSRVGIIGETGSGKSTLLDIVMGLLAPDDGRLSIDGIAVCEQTRRAWQARIAHVPQVIFLADTTIAENIAFGIPPEEIDHSRIRKAAERAQISETIESWSDGYDTFVGERGIRLSGGQRQRIGIARALYKNADVMIFDEATSALDNDTENAVMEAIVTLDQELTVLIVAHRLSTLQKCTQVIELESGRITRTGSYSEIVKHPVKVI